MTRNGKQKQDDVGWNDKSQSRPIIRQGRVPIRSNVTEEYRGKLFKKKMKRQSYVEH